LFSIYPPGAQSVEWGRDFTGWPDKPIRPRAGAQGIGRARVALPPGEHPYRFRVDGAWRDR
jgi:1,4-alpha-glucan branching enzyme